MPHQLVDRLMASRLIPPSCHGGRAPAELDLSVNLNPLGMPDAVRRAVQGADFGTYRSLDQATAIARLARDATADPSRIVLTAGATEGLRLALEVLLPVGGATLLLGPTYGEYRRLAMRRGARVIEVRASAPRFEVPLVEVCEAIRRERPKVVLLCDPNNPTGRGLTDEQFNVLVQSLGPAVLVVDESFAPFARGDRQLNGYDNVTFVRSLTKVHAIPGVRVGYVLSDADTVRAIAWTQDPWAVSAHAIAAATAGGWGLSVDDRSAIGRLRSELEEDLTRQGFAVVPSDANYLLVRARATKELRGELLERGIAIRGCADFGIAGHVRIAVPGDGGRLRLMAAMSELKWNGDLPAADGRPEPATWA